MVRNTVSPFKNRLIKYKIVIFLILCILAFFLTFIKIAHANIVLDLFLVPDRAIAQEIPQIYPSPKPLKSVYRGDTLTDEQSLIMDEIEATAQGSGINPDTLKAIAYAESRFLNVCNYKYTDESGYYTACGIFQITRSTFKAFCGDPFFRFDIHKNIKCAVKIASESGLQHWDESKQGWK